MLRLIFRLSVLLYTCTCQHLSTAQLLPAEMLTDWSSPGLQQNLPVYDTINVIDYGLSPSESVPNDEALRALLDDNSSNPTVFYFPPGTYFFKRPIQLKSRQVLKGNSSENTTFIFDLEIESHLIIAKGLPSNDTIWLTDPIEKGEHKLGVNGNQILKPGDYALLIAEDEAYVTSTWAHYSTGQIVKIVESSLLELQVEKPIRKSVGLLERPRLVPFIPTEFAGVECLSIQRKDITISHTSNVFFDYSVNCWVKGVESIKCNFAHVALQNSTYATVNGCYFSQAFEYGGGGNGYGVVLQFNTGDCLIDNNIFQHLRHSVLLQAGVNGNVVSYNYSIDPFWTEVNLPSNAAGDLVLHGNYPYCNLFEGNIVQNIVIDGSHGTNGPGNAFFRNRAEYYGIIMSNNPASPGQLFVGNEITSTLPLTGNYFIQGGGHFEYGNNVNGRAVPDYLGQLELSSLYLNTEPVYFQINHINIGSIGLPSTMNSGTNAARLRFERGEMTACNYNRVIISNTHVNIPKKLEIHPNPSIGSFKIILPTDPLLKLMILNSSRICVYRKIGLIDHHIDISYLPPGLYFIQAQSSNAVYFGKIILATH